MLRCCRPDSADFLRGGRAALGPPRKETPRDAVIRFAAGEGEGGGVAADAGLRAAGLDILLYGDGDRAASR